MSKSKAPRNGSIVSALLNGSESKKIPLPVVKSPITKKIQAQTDLESEPSAPASCIRPIMSKIIPIKIMNILIIAEGADRKTIPKNMFIMP